MQKTPVFPMSTGDMTDILRLSLLLPVRYKTPKPASSTGDMTDTSRLNLLLPVR